MGTVDIVPGVSGSTVAVLLGIYERFINALKNINAPLIRDCFAPFTHKFSKDSRTQFLKSWKNADMPWLCTLLAGLATAFVVASFIIPALMERFPQVMRGLFFGLVLGSIATPIRSIKKFKWSRFVAIAVFAASFYVILGQQVSPPVCLETVASLPGQSLETICTQAPCFNAPADVLAIPENESLRTIVSNPADILPENTPITIQKPYALFCLLAGFLAICAMLLPGISGSFILLVLGCYYFMLNTGKAFLSGLAHGTFYPMHLLYLACFVLGALIGIALFSRALTWLLKHHRDMTLAAIIGILLGCLRAVWPFRNTIDGTPQLFLPNSSTPNLLPTLIAAFCGLAIVAATIVIQNRFDKKSLQPPSLPDEVSNSYKSTASNSEVPSGENHA